MSARWARIGRIELARAGRLYGRLWAALLVAILAVLVVVPDVIGVVSAGSPAAASPPGKPADPVDPPAGPDASVPPPSPGYAFLVRGPEGMPARLDPCSGVIAVRYNPGGAPYDAEADLSEAVARLEGALGHAFRQAEESAESPAAFESQLPPEPTILVSWAPTAGALDAKHSDSTVGLGEPIVQDNTVVAGVVTLVADATLVPGFGPSSFGAVLLHELGHAVNAGHAAQPSEQMFPEVVSGRPSGWGPGDRTALAYLGGPCPRPTPTTTPRRSSAPEPKPLTTAAHQPLVQPAPGPGASHRGGSQ